MVPSDFFGIEPILAENEIREITPLDRRQRYDFEEIVQNWKFFKLNKGLDDLFPESNSILLETSSYIEGDFCTTFKEVSKRPKDYNLSGKVQIHFDPEKANSDYVKIILNGVLSSKYIRLLSYNGKINHQNLVNLFHLYLPDIDEQRAIADHYNHLSEEIEEKKTRFTEYQCQVSPQTRLIPILSWIGSMTFHILLRLFCKHSEQYLTLNRINN